MTSQRRGSHDDGVNYQKIPLDKLVISAYNIRKRGITTDLDELAQSMDHFGLQQPIVVRPQGDKFEIIIGQRRYLAAKQLKWEAIDARIEEKPWTEQDAKVASFSENIQRTDLDPRDKADVCTYLLEQFHSIATVARHLGVTPQTVRKWLDYAAVPAPMKEMVANKQISRPMATRIAQLVSDPKKAIEIAERVAELKPPKDHQDRIMAAVEEFPERSVDVILQKAVEKKHQKTIIFVLPEKWELPMERATKALVAEPSDIARDATIEWLEAHQY